MRSLLAPLVTFKMSTFSADRLTVYTAIDQWHHSQFWSVSSFCFFTILVCKHHQQMTFW